MSSSRARRAAHAKGPAFFGAVNRDAKFLTGARGNGSGRVPQVGDRILFVAQVPHRLARLLDGGTDLHARMVEEIFLQVRFSRRKLEIASSSAEMLVHPWITVSCISRARRLRSSRTALKRSRKERIRD